MHAWQPRSFDFHDVLRNQQRETTKDLYDKMGMRQQ